MTRPGSVARSTILTAAFLTAALALLAGPLAAQSWRGTAGLDVEVSERGKAPVAGAEVHLLYLEIDPKAGPAAVLTDSRGVASIDGLAEGKWRLEVRYQGKSPYSAVIQLAAGEKITVVAGPVRDAAAAAVTVKFGKVRVAAAPPVPSSAPAPTPVTPARPPEPKPSPPKAAPAPEPKPTAPAPAPEPKPIPPAPAPEPRPPVKVEPKPTPPAPAPPVSAPPAPAPEPKPAVKAEPPATPPAAEPKQVPPVSPPPAPTPPRPEPRPPEPKPSPPVVVPPPAQTQPPPAQPAPSKPEPPPSAPPVVAPPAPPPTRPTPPPPTQQAPAPVQPAPVPEPAPAPPATPPATTPPAAPPAPAQPPVISAGVRSASAGNCPDCKPGEAAVSVQLTAGAHANPGACNADADMKRAVDGLVAAADAGFTGYNGPLVDPATGRLTDAAGAAAGEAANSILAPYLDPAGPCQVLAVVLAPGSRYAGYAYEANDSVGGGACVGNEECEVGVARWTGHPVLQTTPKGTVLYGAFVNRSPDRARRAKLIVYFRPAG